MGFIRKIGDSTKILVKGAGEDHPVPPGFEYWPGTPPEAAEWVRLSKLSPGEAMAHIAALILPLPDALKTVLMPAIGTLRSSLEFGDVGYVTRQIEAMAQSLPPEVAPVMAAIVDILDNTQEGAA
jgi:hypothetical protein